MTIMIAAVALNNGLGKDNQMIWHLPDDFKRFKQLTTGHHIIMGRKTFESFPKPLPNRIHIVVTRQADYAPDGCIVVHSMDDALKLIPQNEDSYIIGGGEIYNLAMPFADKLEITRVYASFEADTFFPEINFQDWTLVSEDQRPVDDRHAWAFSFETYLRKQKNIR